MNKELSDRALACLPREFKEEVKKLARLYSGRTSALFGAERHLANKFLDEFIELFGHHNLTSDAEEEEMLMVEKGKVQFMFDGLECTRVNDEYDRGYKAGKEFILHGLFGPKCLPDETCNVASSDVASNVASSKPKPAEPKYRKGEKVLYKGRVKVVISEMMPNRYYRIALPNNQSPICKHESDLEPYTEPEDLNKRSATCTDDCSSSGKESPKMKPITSKVSVYLATKKEDEEFRMLLHENGFIWNNERSLISQSNWASAPKDYQIHFVHPNKTVTYSGERTEDTLTFSEFKKQYFEENVNLSQETANCDKEFDNILKDSFRDHNRLHIAAMAMQGILANPKLTVWQDIDRKEAHPKIISAAFSYADALIAESEKGGES